jgi:hypothetical protein
MTDRAFPLLRLTALAAALALAACNRTGDEENLADLGNDADPALTSALNDQILVDDNLAAQSNRNAARPSSTPTQSQYPARDSGASAPAGATTVAAAALGQGKGCSSGANFDYNLAWAKRLAPTFPVYPGGKVTEAAANNGKGCSLRVVSFTSGENWQRILDWYHTRAVRAGYSSEHQLRDGDHVLAGANERDKGGAFYLIVTPKSYGSEVSLIANNGY